MNRQIQDDALYNDRFEEEEKKTDFEDYLLYFCGVSMVIVALCLTVVVVKVSFFGF